MLQITFLCEYHKVKQGMKNSPLAVRCNNFTRKSLNKGQGLPEEHQNTQVWKLVEYTLHASW